MTLTDLAARKLKPKETRYEVADDDGLALVILPSGKKSWTLRYTFDTKQKRMTLGKYPAVSLSDARSKQALAIHDIEQGIDPAAKAQDAKLKRIAAPTFDELLKEFWKIELQDKPTGAERRRLATKDVLPVWKTRKVNSITRRDAVLLIDEVRKRAPVGANRLQTVLVRMFNFASERGIIDFSPLVGMRRTKERARARVLTDEEIKKLWSCLDLEKIEIDIFRLIKLALKMILLTGQRPGEVASMRWDQIQNDRWIIPAESRKTREENQIPITSMMHDILQQAKKYSSDSPFVFRSSHNEGMPLTVGALANAIRRHRVEMEIPEQFTPHDLRRTLRTRLAELSVTDIVAELVLGHKLQGILAVYNRYDYAAEKRQALERWETRLREIVGLAEVKSNIIPFEVNHG
jgi:integrase